MYKFHCGKIVLTSIYFQASGYWLNSGAPVSVTGDIPIGRRNHAAGVINFPEPEPSMIIHGGYGCGSTLRSLINSLCSDSLPTYIYYQDMYQFRFSDQRWIQLTPICNTTFPCPSKRSGHLGVVTPSHGFVSQTYHDFE